MTKDERDGVEANITDLGLEGALTYATKRIVIERDERIKRLMVAQIAECCRRLRAKVRSAAFLGRCHARGLKIAANRRKRLAK
jgi:hypothetical protein